MASVARRPHWLQHLSGGPEDDPHQAGMQPAQKSGILAALQADPNGSLGRDGPGYKSRMEAAGAPQGAELRSSTPTRGDGMAAALRSDTSQMVGDRHHDAIKAIGDHGGLPAEIGMGLLTQPLHAMSSVREAYNDPSLSNVTNAGVQVGMSAFNPRVALGALGAGYGAAAASDLGASASSSANAAGLAPDQDARKAALQQKLTKNGSLSSVERSELKGYNETEAAYQVEQNALAAAATKKKMLSEENDVNERRSQLSKDADQKRQQDADAMTTKRGEYDSAVKRATAAREEAMSLDRRFSKTEVGKIYDKTGGAAAPLGAIMAGAAFNPAKNLGQAGSQVAAGGSLAMTLNSLPLAYNAFATEPDNPEKKALSAYSRELPALDPQGQPTRKQEWSDYASGLPDKNPVHEAAQEEMYNPAKWGERLGISALEGIETTLGAKIFGRGDSLLRGKRETGPVEPVNPGASSPGFSQKMSDALIGTPVYREERNQAVQAVRDKQQQLGQQRQLDHEGAGQIHEGAGQIHEGDALIHGAASREASSSQPVGASSSGPNPPARTSQDQGQPLQPVSPENPSTAPIAAAPINTPTIQTPPQEGFYDAMNRYFGPSQGQRQLPQAVDHSADIAGVRNDIGSIRQQLADLSAGQGRLPPPGVDRKAPVRREVVDPYNRPIDGPLGTASPAEAWRDVYRGAATNGMPTTGRGGALPKNSAASMVDAELQRRTGVPDAKGPSETALHDRRKGTEQAAQALSAKEGISYADAIKRLEQDIPLKDKRGNYLPVPKGLMGIMGAGGVLAADPILRAMGLQHESERIDPMMRAIRSQY